MGWRLVQKEFSALINILYVGVIEESSTSSTSGPGLFEPAEVGHQASASLAKPSVCCAAMLWHTAATCLQLMLTGNRIGCSSAPPSRSGEIVWRYVFPPLPANRYRESRSAWQMCETRPRRA